MPASAITTDATEVSLGTPLPRALKRVNDLVDERVNKLIDEYLAWEKELNPVGPAPIRNVERRNAATLRRHADQYVKKAALALGDKALSQVSVDWHKFITVAANHRSGAWLSDWLSGKKAREAQAEKMREAKRVKAEQEATLKPSAKRIAALHKIIAEASSAEILLATIFDAYTTHQKAEAARHELQQTRNAADAAARALSKPPPEISAPQATEAALSMAAVIVRALNSMPSRM